MALPTLTTSRLILRQITPDDAADIFVAFSDTETMHYMQYKPHQTVEETRADLEGEIQRGARYWAICLKGSDEVLGKVGFLGGTTIPGAGYIIRRSHWGRGIMTEALRAALSYGFNEMRLDRVELWINEGNRASQRIADKLAFKLKGRIHQRYEWEENHHIMRVYGMRADEWPDVSNPASMRVPQFFGVEPVLLVHDVRVTAEYYRNKLGFHIDFLFGDPPGHGGVSRGDWSPEAVRIQFSQAEEGTNIQPQGWLYIMVEAEIDSLFQIYLESGVEILRMPQTYPWGMREFEVQDCNGYRLRFGTRDFSHS
jgi:[ribosomal protein S5]-alanine N-acetyltransferase